MIFTFDSQLRSPGFGFPGVWVPRDLGSPGFGFPGNSARCSIPADGTGASVPRFVPPCGTLTSGAKRGQNACGAHSPAGGRGRPPGTDRRLWSDLTSGWSDLTNQELRWSDPTSGWTILTSDVSVRWYGTGRASAYELAPEQTL